MRRYNAMKKNGQGINYWFVAVLSDRVRQIDSN